MRVEAIALMPSPDRSRHHKSIGSALACVCRASSDSQRQLGECMWNSYQFGLLSCPGHPEFVTIFRVTPMDDVPPDGGPPTDGSGGGHADEHHRTHGSASKVPWKTERSDVGLQFGHEKSSTDLV